MAIYHLNARIVKRSKGQSCVAKAAYNAHELLKNENTDERHDYRYKGEVLFSGVFAPKNAPEWAQELAQDRQALWSAVEKAEKRKDAQLAREIEIALPHELSDQERQYLVTDFVRENFARRGMIADVCIHAPSREGDARNHHAHILLTMREIGPDGFGDKVREWNGKAQLQDWREKWEHLANRHLKRHGHAARIDHRSLEAQGIDREPTIHVGPTATDFERDGVKTERGGMNREIEEHNGQLERLRAAEKELSEAISATQRQLDAEIKKRAEELRRQREQEEARAREMREREQREAKAREALRVRTVAEAENIREAWKNSPDAISFMIRLGEHGLMIARDEKGRYAAVSKSGFVHHMPDCAMQEGMNAVGREHSGLNIPTVEEQLKQQHEAREREQQRIAARKGATLYDRADMASMQRDALRHIQDVRRIKEQRAREAEKQKLRRQQELQKQREQQEKERLQKEAQARKEKEERQRLAEAERRKREEQEKARQQREAQAKREKEERERREKQQREAAERQQRARQTQSQEQPRTQAAQKFEHKRATTEQTDAKQRKAGFTWQELMSLKPRSNSGGREHDNDHSRER